VAALLQTERLPVWSFENLQLKWQPGLDVPAKTAAFRADVETRYRRLLSMLVADGLLTDSESAALPPKLSISITDLHGRKGP
jgi:hypothetical protein